MGKLKTRRGVFTKPSVLLEKPCPSCPVLSCPIPPEQGQSSLYVTMGWEMVAVSLFFFFFNSLTLQQEEAINQMQMSVLA